MVRYLIHTRHDQFMVIKKEEKKKENIQLTR